LTFVGAKSARSVSAVSSRFRRKASLAPLRLLSLADPFHWAPLASKVKGSDSAPISVTNYAGLTEVFQFGELRYPFPERLPAILIKVFHNLLALCAHPLRRALPLLLALILSIFVVQFSRC